MPYAKNGNLKIYYEVEGAATVFILPPQQHSAKRSLIVS
jgi:hypothetical protein